MVDPGSGLATATNHDCDPAGRTPQPGRPISDNEELRLEVSACERLLRRTRSVALGRHSCSANDPLFVGGGGPHRCAYMAFRRSSVRIRIGEWRPEVVTPNDVTFHNFGQRFSRESIGQEGDECDWIALSPAIAHQIWPEVYAAPAANTVYMRPMAPIPAHLFLAQRQLFAQAVDPSIEQDDAALQVLVISLARAVVSSAISFWTDAGGKRRRPQPICLRRRIQIVEAAKALMAGEPSAGFSVAELSRRLHCSVAHLSRTFHASTGFRIVDYRLELRLRKGLLLLDEGALEIGHIANRLGFASHSHFTDAFRRRFLMNPSEYIRFGSSGPNQDRTLLTRIIDERPSRGRCRAAAVHEAH